VSRTAGVGVQRRLAISEPGDKHEREADRVATMVLTMHHPPASPPLVQRQCRKCDEEQTIQRKDSGGPLGVVPPSLQSRIESHRGGGQPLPAAEREFFEPRFGWDFRGVRLHTDSFAAESAQQLRATAYTVGNDVFFAAGAYSPGGRELLAHELVHTIQQEQVASGLIYRAARKSNASQTKPLAGDAQARQSLKSAVEDEKIILWINAFIPETIPGLTKPVPKGPHAGGSMIEGPPTTGCFLTDNRGFSSTRGAKTRIRYGLIIDVGLMQVVGEVKYSDVTTGLDCESGVPTCRSMGDPTASYSVEERTAKTLLLHLSSFGANPCVPIAPNIDFEGRILVDKSEGMLTLAFHGRVDEFPAFEMYALSTVQGNPHTVFASMPPEGNTPLSLFGGPVLNRRGFVILRTASPAK
jgi:hypothetical protein